MTAPLRSPDVVMRLSRLGAAFPTRLSFMPSLLRRLAAEGAVVHRDIWDMDKEGFGRATYRVALSGYDYTLCAFSRALPDQERSDRVTATAWDAAFALFDGVPTQADLDRLAKTVPLQEAGRLTGSELILSRANKSMRLFSHVVDRLAAGAQPDPDLLRQTGYLMRTTAVYGNGKFGIAGRDAFAHRPGMAAPFRAEMLAVWLIREFTLDLVEHIAAARAPGQAACLGPAARRYLGIGNSTGLGMAPFLVTHPGLLNAWMTARETARARIMDQTSPAAGAAFVAVFERARAHVAEWQVDDAPQQARIDTLRQDLNTLAPQLTAALSNPMPWRAVERAAATLSLETQELILSLMIEVHGPIVDNLAEAMDSAQELPQLEASQPCADLQGEVEGAAGWALTPDFDTKDETGRFWYTSADKAEPRLGERYDEPGAELERPLDIARQLQRLVVALQGRTDRVADLLLDHPELRSIARRAQAMGRRPYQDIHDNLIAGTMRPIDMLRAKLALFGASRFDPRSDRWTRVCLYQGAPDARSLSPETADHWLFPALT